MKILSPLRIAISLGLTLTVTSALIFNHFSSMSINDAKPLITGKWLYNPGACVGKLPRNGFFDISIFATNPNKVVVNKIILDEGRITELNKEQISFTKEKAETVFALCEKIQRPSGQPTMFHYKHPLKEFSLIYYPKADLLIQTAKEEILLFQRFDSVNLTALDVVDSL